MANNRIIHYAIVTCLLTATVVLGGCAPPLPKTWPPPRDGTILIDRVHGMTVPSPTQQ
jgi:hypothetical protein